MQRLIVLMAVFYLVQVCSSNPGLASLPLVFYLKETLHFQSKDLATFQMIVFLPWMVKPLYGLIVDRFALFGYAIQGYTKSQKRGNG